MTITEITESVWQLLLDEAEGLGRSTGYIQRERKFSGSSFAQTLTGGVWSKPKLSYTHLRQHAALSGVPVSAQGIAARFTAAGAAFMAALLERAVQHSVAASALQVALPILGQFNGVYLRDSSVVQLPACLAEVWSGVGNATGKSAAVKLQVRLNYNSGVLEGPAVQSGRTHDRRTPYQAEDEPAGSLSLADLGYFSLDELQTRVQAQQYVLVRYKDGTTLYDAATGKRVELHDWLGRQSASQVEVQVLVGKRHRLPLRLLAERVPPAALERRKQQLNEYARKKQTPLTTQRLALAEWTVILTNVPPSMLNLDSAMLLLHVRWQVELLFKLWKSYLHIDEWRSANPWRVLCEFYAKLIVGVINQWIAQLELWQYPDRSLFKAFQTTQIYVVPFLAALQKDRAALAEVLQAISNLVCTVAQINKRRCRPPTYQALAACPAPGGLT